MTNQHNKVNSSCQKNMSTCQIMMLTIQMLDAISLVRNVCCYMYGNIWARTQFYDTFSILTLNSRNSVLT